MQVLSKTDCASQAEAKKIIKVWQVKFPKKAQEPVEEKKMKMTGVKHRDIIISKFLESLQTVGDLDDDLKSSDLLERAQEVALNLEAAICRAFGAQSKEYGAKARTLLFNLQDKTNVGLRLKLMAGVYEAV